MNRRRVKLQSLALAGIFLIGGYIGPILHWIDHAEHSHERVKCDHEHADGVHFDPSPGLEEEVCLQCVRVQVLYAANPSLVRTAFRAETARSPSWDAPDRPANKFERSRAPPALPS